MLVAALLVPAGAAVAAPREGSSGSATRFSASENLLKTWVDRGVDVLAGLLERFGFGSSEVSGKAGIDIDPNGAANSLPTPTTDDAGILIDPFG